jgi:tRNA pseudouridine55 synthase
MRQGFLLIDKKAGVTSHDVVQDVRRILHERAIGHLGTLDPIATGLMVLAVGKKALKVLELFAHLPKEYLLTLEFGATSPTYDTEGPIVPTHLPAGWVPPDHTRIHQILLERFRGHIAQVPPAFSAVHTGGERAYRKARRGEAVTLPARTVDILSCDIVAYDYPHLTLCINASAGKYMRTIAHDLGAIIRAGAYMTKLRRTKVGDWSVDDACSVDATQWTSVTPLKDILSGFPARVLTDAEWDHLSHGRSIDAVHPPATIGWYGGLPCAIVEKDPRDAARVKARKVL